MTPVTQSRETAATEQCAKLRRQLAEITTERDRWIDRVRALEKRIDRVREAITPGK